MAFSIYSSSSYQITNQLTKLGTQLALSNKRLTTGKKINSAADNPAAIIALSSMRSQMAEIDAKNTNAQRLNSIFSTADGSLGEISDMLDEIESNLINASDDGATAEEKAAYQANIDEAIKGIDRLINTTNFNGTKLLDGSMSYSVSGINSSVLTDVRIDRATTSNGSDITMNVELSEAGAASLSTNGFNAVLAGEVRMTVTGPDGNHDFTFAAGTGRAAMAATVTAQSGTTGVTAANTDGEVVFTTTGTGSDKSVSINITSGSEFLSIGNGTANETATGTAPGVTINGQSFDIDDNYQVSFNNSSISGSFSVVASAYGSVVTTSFTVSGGGANLSMGLGSGDAIEYGMTDLDSNNLGTAKLGYLASLKSGGDNDISSGNFTTAQSILDKASSQVSFARGRVGAIQSYTVDSTINSLDDTKEALQSSIESIENLDYALETANNTRLQLLMEIGASIFNTLNSNMTSSIQSLLTL